MKNIRTLAAAGLFALLPSASFAQAPAGVNLEAGKAKVDLVCANCHGANGVSVSDTIPNLAGQRVAYLQSQLNALKSGTRKNAVMNAIASQLSPADIANVAAYFASLSTPTNLAVKSEPFPALLKTQVAFPENYKTAGFTMYQTVNRTDINQVRYLWANAVAVKAAREGKPLPDGSVLLLEQHAAKLDADKKPVTGADGYYVSDRLLAYALMGHGPGWGKDIPDILRNGDWNYAVYGPDMKLRAGVQQGECLACHKPLDNVSYLISHAPLTTAAKAR